MIDAVLRHVPGHHWVRPFLTWGGTTKPGHRWLYGGSIRRDAWRVGPIGFGLLRMPHQHVRGGRCG